MDEIITFCRDWGSWATAAVAVAIALRTHASTSASTIRQLAKWLNEAREKIKRLEARIESLETDRERLANEVERLTPFEQRATSLATELRSLHASIGAGGGAQVRAISLVRDKVQDEVVQLAPQRSATTEGE